VGFPSRANSRVFPGRCVESVVIVSNSPTAQIDYAAKETYFAKSIVVVSSSATVILLDVKRYPIPGRASITQILIELLGIMDRVGKLRCREVMILIEIELSKALTLTLMYSCESLARVLVSYSSLPASGR